MPTTNFTNMGGKVRGESVGGLYTGYNYDALGNVIRTHSAAGLTVSEARFKPHGDTISLSGTTPTFGWNGAWGYFPAAGQSHSELFVRARFYSILEGRWISLDSLWPLENSYDYADANPTTFFDPSGQWTQINECRRDLCDGNYHPCKSAQLSTISNAFKAACKKINMCDDKCLKCMRKNYQYPATLLVCMQKQCGPQGGATISCSGLICLLYGGCARAPVWSPCSIQICTKTTASDCWGTLFWKETCYTLTPLGDAGGCGPLDQTITHELSHCCGTDDSGPDEDPQAERIMRCIYGIES